MSKKKNYEETSIIYKGKNTTLKKFALKEERRLRNGRTTFTNCPNCLSTLKLNEAGNYHCTSDRLHIWDQSFTDFEALKPEEKAKYINNLSNYSSFIDLYDRWVYAKENNAPEEFNCGYTNETQLPIGRIVSKIPDPIVVKRLESKLKRKLTEEELLGESELWWYRGKVLTEWKKKAILVRIPYIILPSEETIYVY